MSDSASQRSIDDWLSNIDDFPKAKVPTKVLNLKKNLAKMEEYLDDTPKAKRRQLTGLGTPASAHTDSVEDNRLLPHDQARSSCSSRTTSSRKSSPSKRQRAAEIEFSKPEFEILSRLESKEWISGHIVTIPLLEKLTEYVSKPLESSPIEDYELVILKDDYLEILHQVERCKLRDATEDMWSDNVVLPTMQLAQRISRCKDIQIVNVKSMNVWPANLLPTNVRSSNVKKKRVDYSIGCQLTDSRTTREILKKVQHNTLSLSDHKMVRDLVLCSHLEIKADSGTVAEAQSQLQVWCAAGFRKQENMWVEQHGMQAAPLLKLAPVPLWLWQRTTVHLWIAVMDSQNDKIDVLDYKSFTISEDHVQSLETVVLAMVGVMAWGRQCVVPWFKDFIGRSDLIVCPNPT